jgi:hypothetical protein
MFKGRRTNRNTFGMQAEIGTQVLRGDTFAPASPAYWLRYNQLFANETSVRYLSARTLPPRVSRTIGRSHCVVESNSKICRKPYRFCQSKLWLWMQPVRRKSLIYLSISPCSRHIKIKTSVRDLYQLLQLHICYSERRSFIVRCAFGSEQFVICDLFCR